MTTKEKNTIWNFAELAWQDVMVSKNLVDKYPDDEDYYQREFDKSLAKYRAIEELIKELKLEY